MRKICFDLPFSGHRNENQNTPGKSHEDIDLHSVQLILVLLYFLQTLENKYV